MQATSVLQASQAPPAAAGANTRAGKYLIFNLGAEEFGTEVLKVREIMGMQDITTIPQVPSYVKGVINLRGKVIPVIDLRLKFAMDAQEYTPRTCIIVMRTRQAEEELTVGMIVDGVVEVLNLAAADIEDTPDFGPSVDTPFLIGMAKIKGKVKILLDIDQVLASDELGGFSGTLQ
jgi:purine-binding chemotaxis protein CheW